MSATTRNQEVLLLVDDSVPREALAAKLPEYRVLGGTWCSPEECLASVTTASPRLLVVNAHHCFGANHSRSACQGLRLVELVRMEPDVSVPIVVYGWWLPEHPVMAASGRPLPVAWSRFTSVLRLGALPRDSALTAVLSLPVTPDELATEVAGTMATCGTSVTHELRRLTLELLEAEIERQCHGIRHRHQSVLAAVRLLLGAFARGHIGEETLSEALSGLVGEDDGIAYLVALQRRWEEARRRLTRDTLAAPPSSESTSCTDRPLILIVDDHLEVGHDTPERSQGAVGDLGWQAVYDALLSQSTHFNCDVKYAGTYEEALNHCTYEQLAQTDLVILDVDLGDAHRSGLHLLHRIRSVHPFVPVLQMTAFDDAEVCQTALEFQADRFFVKQLIDSSDRSSALYYDKFAELVGELLGEGKPDRGLYERFVGLLPAIVHEDWHVSREHVPRIEDGVTGELAKLFMLLRMTGRHHLLHSLLSSTTHKSSEENHDELMLVLLDAIVAWLNWGRTSQQVAVRKLADWLGEYRTEDARRAFVKQTEAKWSPLRHAHLVPVTIGDVRHLTSALLDWIERSLAETQDGTPLPVSADQPQRLAEVVARARVREARQVAAHSVRSRMGAEGVLLGSYLLGGELDGSEMISEYRAFGPEDPARDVIDSLEISCETALGQIPPQAAVPRLRLSLIDDHGVENGWAYATALIHNGGRLRNIVYGGAPAGLSQAQYAAHAARRASEASDLILLDLQMPATDDSDASVGTGLEVARCIRQLDPLIPIVVLTAHPEAATMRRAIRYGANEFFPKEAPGAVTAEDLESYARSYASLPAKLGIAGQGQSAFVSACRKVLQRLDSLGQEHRVALPWLVADDGNLPALLRYVGLGVESGVDQLAIRVANHVRWLFRRALFFVFMGSERYLSTWVDYFTRAVPGLELPDSDVPSTWLHLRPKYLGYDSAWLDCAMIVEFVFNLVAVGLGLPSEYPGRRDRFFAQEMLALRDAIGNASYDLGMEIWNRRNERRHEDRHEQPEVLVERCTQFMDSLGFLAPADPEVEAPEAGDSVDALQANLLKSRRRAVAAAALSAKKREIEKHARHLAAGGTQSLRRFQDLQIEIRSLEAELLVLRPRDVVDERHAICNEFWGGPS